MNFSELRDLMLLYAADLVDDQEREQVERWLASGDPVAAAVLAEARAILAYLPASLDPAQIDDAMWERLAEKLDDGGTQSAPVAGRVAPPRETPRRSWAPLAWAAVAALIAGVTVYFITDAAHEQDRHDLAQLQQTVTDQQRDLQNLAAELDSARVRYTQELENIAGLRDQLAQQDAAYKALSAELTQSREAVAQANEQAAHANDMIALLSAPELQSVQLAGSDERPDAVGRALWDADRGRIVFTAARLPAAEQGSTYQLWFVTDPDGPVSLGTFEVGAGDRLVYGHAFDAVPGTVQAVAVSLEPAGGSPDPAGPTGPIVMVGAVQ